MQNDQEVLSQLLQSTLGIKKVTAQLSLVLADRTLAPTEISFIHNQQAKHLHIHATYEKLAAEDLYISWEPSRQHLICERQMHNTSGKTLELVEAGLHLKGITLSGARRADYFYNTENPRIYGIYAIPLHLNRLNLSAAESEYDAVAGNKWADPGTITDRIGASVYQPFPAVLLSNHETESGFVHGSLSQDIFFHNYLFRHEDDTIAWDIFSSCKAVATRRWNPGEDLHDHWYLGRTEQAADITRMFDGYTAVLRTVLPANYGTASANRHHIVWGSWNDGIFRDIDEERLFQMTEYLKKEYPTVRWIQIDDGYATRANTAKFAHGMGVPFEEDGIDLKKLPNGMRGLSDGIKERGLTPAVWIGGLIPNNTPLAEAHPEWMCDYSYRLKTCKPLDISIPEARAYMIEAMRCFTQHWRFQSIKFDFWSYVFEDSHPLLSDNERTGYEWRRWFLHQVREMLPRDAYFQSGCDVCMGNPFLGEWFNNYRYGIDIGSGNWEHIKPSMLWGTACFATHTGDLIVPNSDSISILPKLSEEDAHTVINYCLITRSVVEIGGWLYQQPEHPRAAWVKKAICCPNNGQDVFYANFNYREQNSGIPTTWYLKTAHFSREENMPALPARTVALFNNEESTTTTPLTPEALDLPAGEYLLTNIWTLETRPFSPGESFTLPPHQSCLYAVSPRTTTLQVLDSNIGILASKQTGQGLELSFLSGGSLVLVLNTRPEKSFIFNNIQVEATIEQGGGNYVARLELSAPGVLQISS